MRLHYELVNWKGPTTNKVLFYQISNKTAYVHVEGNLVHVCFSSENETFLVCFNVGEDDTYNKKYAHICSKYDGCCPIYVVTTTRWPFPLHAATACAFGA